MLRAELLAALLLATAKRHGLVLATGLDIGLPGITPRLVAMLAEAAAVCHESQVHEPCLAMTVLGLPTRRCRLRWVTASVNASQARNDREYPTEHGAVAIAALLAVEALGYTVIRRSHKGTGFDYWLGELASPSFLNKAVMVLPGIQVGTSGMIDSRVRTKPRQVENGHKPLPACVIVVGLSRPVPKVAQT